MSATARFIRLVTVAMVMLALIHSTVTHPYVARLWCLLRAPAPATYTVPVKGVERSALRASFGAPRSGNRRHQGIDIMAAGGTPVLAAADGVVVSTRANKLGGTVVWILGSARRSYYYAHLQEIAEDIHVGRFVRAGEMIGRVGTTGNATGGPPHLHFGIYAGGALDPFPLLRSD